MKFLVLTVLAAAGVALGQNAKTCDAGLFGESCTQVCGGCKPVDGAVTCDKTTGACADGCDAGWQSAKGSGAVDDCSEPMCFGKGSGDAGCDNEGQCIAPNYCICGKSGAQVVGVYGDYEGGTGTQCISLRMSGLKGAFIALVVMFVSISFCGFVERSRNKGKKD